MSIIIYSILLFSLTIYSYALVDPNLTLISHPLWVLFREKMVFFGYYRRDLSWIAYMAFVIALYIYHYYFVKNSHKISMSKILIATSLILVFSYPFLSHDFFNYIFDAKIVTVYHQSPYFHKALDFPQDEWLRFMHWTHRSYPYGPVWIVTTILPSFLSFGKFILNFFFFKSMFIVFYLASILYLDKLNRKWAIFFATNPLIIIEGLVNTHNDFIALGFGIIGVFYLLANKKTIPVSLEKTLSNQRRSYFFGLLHLLLSVGIKYITFPIVFLNKNKKDKRNLIIFLSVMTVLVYLILTSEIQPWYFLNLFVFIPYFYTLLSRFNIFFAGLLLSYYPYIRLGGWDKIENIDMKHSIITIFFLINIVFLLIDYAKNKYTSV